MRFKIVFIAFFFNFTRGDNVLHRNMRNARFLKFDTSANGDIEVNLELSIPFVKIPIKKIQSMTSDIVFPTINVNIIGMALGGIAILGTAIILPFLTKSIGGDDNERYGRLSDQAVFSGHDILQMGSKFFENNRYFEDCTLRFSCLAAKHCIDYNSFYTLEQISRNIILSSILNTTALEDALTTGWSRQRCKHPCHISDEKLDILIKNMSGLT